MWWMAAAAAIQVAGNVYAANKNVDSAKDQRKELQRQAKNELAGSHRVVYDQKRAGERAVARVVALATGQGGTSDDETISNNIAEMNAQTNFNISMELWNGRDRARQLYTTGDIMVDNAKGQRTAAYISSAGTILGAGYKSGMWGGTAAPAASSSGGFSPVSGQTNLQKMGFG